MSSSSRLTGRQSVARSAARAAAALSMALFVLILSGSDAWARAAVASRAAAPCQGIDRRLPAAEFAAAKALQRTVRAAPLYAAAASVGGIAACRFTDDSGVLTLEYRFRDGGWLRVKRDPRIEYSEQEAHLSPALTNATGRSEELLGRAERAAFAPDGCGIDWKQPETEAAEDSPGAEDSVYRGETCNCQARIRRNSAGSANHPTSVLALILRSAC